jgi:hypothetical protein
LVSDSRWRGVSPAHEHNWSARAKRCTSPISATKTAAKIAPDPVDGLHRAVAGVPAQPGGEHPGVQVDLEAERVEQPAQ